MIDELNELMAEPNVRFYKYVGYDRNKDGGYGMADKMPEHGSIIYYSDIDIINNRKSLEYSIESVPELMCFELPFCCGSDYSGCIVEKSNHEAVYEDIGKYAGIYDVHGGYGTFSIVVCIKDFIDNEEMREEVMDIVRRLLYYPLYDEDHHSNMEWDLQEEAWDNWAENDYVIALENRFDIAFFDDVSRCDVQNLFNDVCDRINEYWFDDYGNMYIDVDKIAEATTLKDIVDHDIYFHGYKYYKEFECLKNKIFNDVDFVVVMDGMDKSEIERYSELLAWVCPNFRKEDYECPFEENW
jgi:hypothetical protein